VEIIMSVNLQPGPIVQRFAVQPDQNIFRVNIHLERFQKVCRVAWQVFSYIVFPIGLVSLGVKYVAKHSILLAIDTFNAHQIQKQIEKLEKQKPASLKVQEKLNTLNKNLTYIEHLKMSKNNFIEKESNHASQILVITADGIEIDTLAIQNEDQLTKEPKDQKWIVFFVGNDSCYEQLLHYYKTISESTGANIYSGNYRGVMESKGAPNSTHDLVLDGEAMVQKLLADGVPPENILIHGWSLGGGVATEVSSYHQEKGHEMGIVNDRSFASLISATAGLIPVVGGLLGRIIWLAGWRFNSLANYKKIKQEDKFIIVGNKNDQVIAHKASLYKAYKNSRNKKEFSHLKIEGKKVHANLLTNIAENPDKPHDFNPFYLEAYTDQVKLALKLREPSEEEKKNKILKVDIRDTGSKRMDALDAFTYKAENVLTTLSKTVVLAPLAGLVKVIAGIFQTIIGSCATLIYTVKANKILQERCWEQSKHGLGNIASGFLETFPFASWLKLVIKRRAMIKLRNESKKNSQKYWINTKQNEKFMPYNSIKLKNWELRYHDLTLNGTPEQVNIWNKKIIDTINSTLESNLKITFKDKSLNEKVAIVENYIATHKAALDLKINELKKMDPEYQKWARQTRSWIAVGEPSSKIEEVKFNWVNSPL
jgi:hypothetical protein